jgi:excisionase family DNA binding protein
LAENGALGCATVREDSRQARFSAALRLLCDPPAILCNLRRLTPRTGICQETHMNIEPVAISVNNAARTLGIGRTSIYALLKDGRLDAIKIGRRTLLTTDSIRRLAQPPSRR